MSKIAFYTLGCRSNYADSTEIMFAVVERGGEIVDFESDADIYIINTCTVTKGADKDALRIIRQLKKRRPNAKIIVMGCFAQVGFENCDEKKLVNAIIKKSDKNNLLNLIFDEKQTKVAEDIGLANFSQARTSIINKPLSPLLKGPGESVGATQMRSRFHLRIQDGCENYCTYCIVPKARGGWSSRNPELILQDIRVLSALGYEEIVLTGTHIGAYGIDIGTSLFALLRQIEREFQREMGREYSTKVLFPRIRLSSLDPNELTDDLITLLASSGFLCNYLHVCFQSFSDKILKLMGRKYSLDDAVRQTLRAKEQIKNLCIGSDLICGFFGESREDVNQEVQTFFDLPISYLHVFSYTERAGTAALRLPNAVSLLERKERAALWREHSKQRRGEFLNSLCGSELEIIVEKKEGQQIRGVSREYAEVRIATPNAQNYKIGSRLRVIVQDDKFETIKQRGYLSGIII